jgi:acyl-CoA synthetase (NDP forming)
MDCADLWAKNPGLAGDKVASVSLSGGNLAYFVDACGVRGIAHPEFPPQTQSSLRAILPPLAVVANPVDLSSSADVARGDQGGALVTSLLPPVLSILDASGQDAIVAILTLPPESDLQALLSLETDRFVTPTIVIWAGDSREGRTSVNDLRRAGLTVFQTAVSCAQALQHFRTVVVPAIDVGLTSDRAWPLVHARTRLATAGLIFPDGQVVGDPDDAVAVAVQLGYPVAIKSAAAGLVHKAAAGGVLLGLRTESDVRDAYRSVVQAARSLALPDPHSVLVEKMIHGDDAIFASVTHDDSFGFVALLGRTQELNLDRGAVSAAALDLLSPDELTTFIRATLGDRVDAALGSIRAAIQSARDVAESENVELVEINPLLITGSRAWAVDCVITRRARA